MSLVSRAPRLIAWIFAAVLAVLAIISLFALTTETGSKWIATYLIERLNDAENMEIRVENIGGHLFSNISFSDISITTNDVSLEIAQLDLAWQPLTYFSGQTQVQEIRARQVSLNLLENPASTPEPSPWRRVSAARRGCAGVLCADERAVGSCAGDRLTVLGQR